MATKITYNNIITEVADDKTATIKCGGKLMKSDLVINGKSKITYNNVETNVEEGQVATLKCKGKKMISDVVVRVLKAITAFKASITGLGNSSPTSQVYTRDEGFPTSFEEVTDSFGNIFIKIPTMYRKVDSVVDNQITAFTMSTAKVDDTYEPYSVFVKPNGEVMPYVLIGKYCSDSATQMRSTASGASTFTINNARTYAKNLGAGYQIYDWQFQKLFVDLALLIGQKVDFNNGIGLTNYLGIYNLNRFIFIDGATQQDKNWIIAYDPNKYINNPNSSTDGYVALNYNYDDGKVVKLGYDVNHPFFNYPTQGTNDTAYDTYYCDATGGNSNTNPIYTNTGRSQANDGLWSFSMNDNWSVTVCARLCYRPLDESI